MINTAKLNACKVDRYVPVHSARVLGACVEPAGRDAARRAIARLYAWDATRREGRERKPNKAHLIALLRSDATVHVRLSGILVAAVAGA